MDARSLGGAWDAARGELGRGAKKSGWAIVLVAGFGACTWHDDEARLQGPPNALAERSFASLWLLDGCAGGGKVNFCSTETVEEVLEQSIDDPRVLRFAEANEVPSGLPADTTHLVVQGLSAGTTKVRVKARFSDGERTTELQVNVAKVDAIQLRSSCAEDQAALRVLPGKVLALQVEPQNAGKPLDGFLPELLRGAGVSCTALSWASRMTCSWTAPLEGGAVDLTSGVLPRFARTIRSYGPSDVKAIRAPLPRSAEPIVGPGWTVRLPTATVLEDGVPCESLPVHAETLTPSVCTGPEGAPTWDASTSYELSVKILQTGACKLKLGAVGANTLPSTTEFSMRVASQLTADHLAFPETPCSVEGATTCKTFYSAMVCENGRWRDSKTCAKGFCEFVLSGDRGCAHPDGCATCQE